MQAYLCPLPSEISYAGSLAQCPNGAADSNKAAAKHRHVVAPSRASPVSTFIFIVQR